MLLLEINGSGWNLFVLKVLNLLKILVFSIKEYDMCKNVLDRFYVNIVLGIIVCFEIFDVLVCCFIDFIFSFIVLVLW